MTPQLPSISISYDSEVSISKLPGATPRDTRVGPSIGVVASILERRSSHGRTDVGSADVDPWMAAWILAVARRVEQGRCVG
jgi:hypothetical protein